MMSSFHNHLTYFPYSIIQSLVVLFLLYPIRISLYIFLNCTIDALWQELSSVIRPPQDTWDRSINKIFPCYNKNLLPAANIPPKGRIVTSPLLLSLPLIRSTGYILSSLSSYWKNVFLPEEDNLHRQSTSKPRKPNTEKWSNDRKYLAEPQWANAARTYKNW